MDTVYHSATTNGFTGIPKPMPKVLIIQQVLPHYRVPFFLALHRELVVRGIELELAFGHSPHELPLINEPWATAFQPLYLFKNGPVWQPVSDLLKGKDFVVVEQANKLLLNYWLLAGRFWHKTSVGIWGHGTNRVRNPWHPANLFKHWWSKQAHWWFAYTKGVQEILVKVGYPAGKISVVQNAMDTAPLQKAFASISPEAVQKAREKYQVTGAHVAVYCGRMYPEKKLPWLIEACKLVRAQVPDFTLLLVGDGPDWQKIQQLVASYEWIHLTGPLYGSEKALVYKMASVMLTPGLTGLNLLDAFTAEIPPITTHFRGHSPEIEYLQHGYNGWATPFALQAYAEATVRLLTDGQLRNQLQKGCRETSQQISFQYMVEAFADGIEAALASRTV